MTGETQVGVFVVTPENVGSAEITSDTDADGRPAWTSRCSTSRRSRLRTLLGDQPFPLLPGLGHEVFAFPFTDIDLELTHDTVEPGATIESSVAIVVPKALGTAVHAMAKLCFSGMPAGGEDAEAWTADTAGPLEVPAGYDGEDLPVTVTAEALSRHMAQEGLSSYDLATTLGLDVADLHRVQEGHADPTRRLSRAMASALGVPAKALGVPRRIVDLPWPTWIARVVESS